MRSVAAELGLPTRLSEVGVPEEGIPQLVEGAEGDGCTLVNPRGFDIGLRLAATGRRVPHEADQVALAQRLAARLNPDLIGRSGDRLPRSDDTSHFRSVSPSTRNRTPVPSVMLCEAKHRQCSAARFVALAARSVQHDIRRNAWALEIYVPRLLLLVC